MSRGRKTKCTEEVICAFEEAIISGLSDKRACDLLSISHDAFYRWIRENNEFNDRIKKARSEKIQRLIARIQYAGSEQWQANAWLLERCHHDEFGIKKDLKLTGDLDVSIGFGEEADLDEREKNKR